MITISCSLLVTQLYPQNRANKRRRKKKKKMAAALLSPPPPTLSPSKNPSFPLNLPNIWDIDSRGRREWWSSKKSHVVVSSSSGRTSLVCRVQRRDVVLLGISSSAALLLPSTAGHSILPVKKGLHAEVELDEDVKMALVVDEINAYSLLYPTELPAKKFVFRWVESRKPERYSSAAPLAPNARQRIVSERVDMINNLVISVSIGPPNARYLTLNDKRTWTAKDVADSVLSDKSALPVTTDKRMVESSVLDAHSNEVDGEPYWYYEYIVRKSPTKSAQESSLYRHNLASTAERDGYLYTLNASTLSKQWENMGPYLQKTVASFRLVPPTDNYVPPYKDPWRFW